MLTTLGLAIYLFFDFIFYLIIFDVILSWLSIIGIKYRPKFLSSIIDPIYKKINNIIPTTIGIFRFDALIAIMCIFFIEGLLIMFIPGLKLEINNIINYF